MSRLGLLCALNLPVGCFGIPRVYGSFRDFGPQV